MDLTSQALPESWYRGEGWKEIVDTVKEVWGGVVATVANLAKSFSEWSIKLLKKVNVFGVNLGDWFEEDPISAAAGTAAIALGTVVAISVVAGGGVAGAIGTAGRAIAGSGLWRGLAGGVKWLWKSAKTAYENDWVRPLNSMGCWCCAKSLEFQLANFRFRNQEATKIYV